MYLEIKDPKMVESFKIRHSLREQLISVSWGVENEILINLPEISSLSFFYNSKDRSERPQSMIVDSKEIIYITDEININYSNGDFLFVFFVDGWSEEDRRKVKDFFLRIRSIWIHFKQDLNPTLENLNSIEQNAKKG
jgi:hypothetical protein